MLVEGQHTCVLWTSVPLDWIEPETWVERALADIDTTAWTVVVLHDLPTGAMDHLPRFLDELDTRGVEVRADNPDRCTPIRRGCPPSRSASSVPRLRMPQSDMPR